MNIKELQIDDDGIPLVELKQNCVFKHRGMSASMEFHRNFGGLNSSGIFIELVWFVRFESIGIFPMVYFAWNTIVVFPLGQNSWKNSFVSMTTMENT
jgi:hypothetical protein